MRLLIILLFISHFSFAQLQLKVGINSSRTSGTKSRLGYQLGVGKDFKLGNKFFITPEAMISLKRSLYSDSTLHELHLNYIEPGVLFGIEDNDKYFFVGNAISFNVFSKSKTRVSSNEFSFNPLSLTNNTDIIQIIGFGYKFKALKETFFLEARYSFGYIYQYQKQRNSQLGVVAGIYF